MSINIFFYGLFMDINLLLKKGTHPIQCKKGYVNDYALTIGDRASLTPCKNERTYGILMTIDDNDVQTLYVEASVADYLPEEVLVHTFPNETIKAICYNLPPKLITGTNPSYARELYRLSTTLDFPKDYSEKIRRIAEKETDSQ
ncbi:MAG: gamma-glutamylcyclotransferase family protein [Chitinophagales bacterium]